MRYTETTGDVQTDYYYYDESGNVFGFKRGDSEYYYIRNGQGDIIGILDSSGTQIVSYVYDSWGKLVSISGSQADTIGETNPFRYRGYYYDTETGLYYLQSRYYDPEVGRFINVDNAIGVNGDIHTYNLFTYCGNNSVNRVDPTGNAWVLAGKRYIYDGSLQDFRRSERGDPPLAYSRDKEILEKISKASAINTITNAIDSVVGNKLSKLPTKQFVENSRAVTIGSSSAKVYLSSYQTIPTNRVLKGVGKVGVTAVLLYGVDIGIDAYNYGLGTTDFWKASAVTTATTALSIGAGALCSLIPGPGWALSAAILSGVVIGVAGDYVKEQWIGY